MKVVPYDKNIQCDADNGWKTWTWDLSNQSGGAGVSMQRPGTSGGYAVVDHTTLANAHALAKALCYALETL